LCDTRQLSPESLRDFKRMKTFSTPPYLTAAPQRLSWISH